MEVFYLKINRASNDTVYYLSSWLEAISTIPDAKVYILCDNPNLKNYVKQSINFGNLDYEFLESNRTAAELKYIVDSVITNNWKNAAYAQLTTFLHARDMGYKDFWNIDADDIKLYVSPQRIVELFMTVKKYANSNKINAFALDVWVTLHLGYHWSFGVVYTDNSIDWLKIIRDHCKDTYFFERYRQTRVKINLDWFFTYLNEIKTINLETFYVENLQIIHDMGHNPYIDPMSSIRYWKNGKLRVSVFENSINNCDFGSLTIPEQIIKFDLGLSAEEGLQTLRRGMDKESIRGLEFEQGLNMAISVIFPLCEKSKTYTPPPSVLLDCLLNQSLRNFQVIFVDNGKNLEFINAIKSVEDMFHARLKIVQSNSENIFEMFNEGLAAAQGKYILFANGEDLFLDNFLETLYQIAEQTNSEIVYPSSYGVPVNEISADNKNLEVDIATDEKNLNNETFLYSRSDENFNLCLQCFLGDVFYPRISNKLINRNFLIENDIKISADASMPEWIFILKCLYFAKKFIAFPNVLYVQLAKENLQPDSDMFKVIAGANELKNFLSDKKFFSDNPEMFKAIWNKYFEKVFAGKKFGDNEFFKL